MYKMTTNGNFQLRTLMNRPKSFDMKLSQKLQNPRLARSFILALLEGRDALSVEDALKQMIRRMGIKEFSALRRFEWVI